MKDVVRVYFTVTRVLALIFGILLCITIIGAILGIPMIIASNKFRDASNMSNKELVENRGTILGWGIFLAIIFSPTIFGLIILLVLAFMVDNYIKNIEQGYEELNNRSFVDTVEEGASKTWQNVKETFSGSKTDLDRQKVELKKLEKMREENLISTEEYETLRKKILGL